MRPFRWPAYFRSPYFWVIAVSVAAGLALLSRELDLETVRAKAAGMNGVVAFLLLTVLPLVGFPASALHVVAGLRFGVVLGLALVWLSILLQLLASYGLVRWRRRFFAKRFRTLRQRIPRGAHTSVTLFTILIPGAPYFAQNYILPLIGVPLRPYLLICLPIHGARAIITVAFGGLSHQLTLGRVLLILAYSTVLFAASWWALRRLRTKLAVRPRAANGRKPAA